MNQSSRSTAVVVIPVYKETPSDSEQIAYRQCIAVLGEFPIVVVAPKGFDLGYYKDSHPSVDILFFESQYFQSVQGYNRFLLYPKFYESFVDYDCMLIYQLDAFVFRNELLHWCSQDYAYIGAPWFEGFTEATPEAGFIGVGNGGFSLRRPAIYLQVLNTFSFLISSKPK